MNAEIRKQIFDALYNHFGIESDFTDSICDEIQTNNWNIVEFVALYHVPSKGRRSVAVEVIEHTGGRAENTSRKFSEIVETESGDSSFSPTTRRSTIITRVV